MSSDQDDAGNNVDKAKFAATLRKVYKRAAETRDDHGQPKSIFRKGDVTRRQIDELIGSLRGIMADGELVPKEVQFLNDWIQNNPYAAMEWPASVLHDRIMCAMYDGKLDDDELVEIHSLIAAIIGNKSGELESGVNSTTLPLTTPAPLITHKGKYFCFTGKLYWGKRGDAESLIIKLGGDICGVSEKLNYLVIGELSSRDWLHSTHGLKIKRALDMVQQGRPLSIVSEQHWASSLPKN